MAFLYAQGNLVSPLSVHSCRPASELVWALEWAVSVLLLLAMVASRLR